MSVLFFSFEKQRDLLAQKRPHTHSYILKETDRERESSVHTFDLTMGLHDALPQRPRRCTLLLLLIAFFVFSRNAEEAVTSALLGYIPSVTQRVNFSKDESLSAFQCSRTRAARRTPFPRILFASATANTDPARPSRFVNPEEDKTWSFDTDLKPMLTPWRDLRATLRESRCFTTRALPRLTATVPTTAASHEGRGERRMKERVELTNRTDPSVSPLTLPPVCRKPVILISGRSRDCLSCNHFAEEVLGDYAAEWAYILTHVTVVDAGDPMSEQLARFPYPLWYNEDAMEHELVLTPRFAISDSAPVREGGSKANDAETAIDSAREAARGAPSTTATSTRENVTDASADYALFSAGLRQKAALLVKAPVTQAGHAWSRLVRRTFAHPNEYVLRIVFMYPHNGSIMRDVVNEGIFEGSSPEYLHFFTDAQHFFHAVRKAVRVMNWLERFGDY